MTLPLRPLRRRSSLIAAVGYLPLPAAQRAAHPGTTLAGAAGWEIMRRMRW